jgi:hypothetical protein
MSFTSAVFADRWELKPLSSTQHLPISIAKLLTQGIQECSIKLEAAFREKPIY